MDFNPDLTPKEKQSVPASTEEQLSQAVVQSEVALVNGGTLVGNNSDVVTINNLLTITQNHINDDNKCREAVNSLTRELNNSIHLMSIKEMLEYLKVKIKEREFHIDCIFKAYSFIQRSEYAREMFMGSHRKEKIIEATDRKRINGLLSILNNTEDNNSNGY